VITRATLTLAASAAVLAGGMTALPAPAEAQSNISEVIVYGNDPCPRSTESEVVVCARKPEAERYRLPEKYRPSGPPQLSQSWANKARQLETVGATGTQSCSPVGPGGFTGCLTQLIKTARTQQRQQAEDSQPPP
jgi:hypothetical protein